MDAIAFVSNTVRNLRTFNSVKSHGYALSTPIKCADGFEVSVQASGGHRSSPRTSDGPWSEFELGFPSQPEELLRPYAEDPEDLTNTVFNYVPADVVLAVIEKHGGLHA